LNKTGLLSKFSGYWRKGLDKKVFGRPSLGNVFVGNFLLIPLFGHIEIAVTTPVFTDIGLSIDARANDIPISVPVS
jgi:hypothetical protein